MSQAIQLATVWMRTTALSGQIGWLQGTITIDQRAALVTLIKAQREEVPRGQFEKDQMGAHRVYSYVAAALPEFNAIDAAHRSHFSSVYTCDFPKRSYDEYDSTRRSITAVTAKAIMPLTTEDPILTQLWERMAVVISYLCRHEFPSLNPDQSQFKVIKGQEEHNQTEMLRGNPLNMEIHISRIRPA